MLYIHQQQQLQQQQYLMQLRQHHQLQHQQANYSSPTESTYQQYHQRNTTGSVALCPNPSYPQYPVSRAHRYASATSPSCNANATPIVQYVVRASPYHPHHPGAIMYQPASYHHYQQYTGPYHYTPHHYTNVSLPSPQNANDANNNSTASRVAIADVQGITCSQSKSSVPTLLICDNVNVVVPVSIVEGDQNNNASNPNEFCPTNTHLSLQAANNFSGNDRGNAAENCDPVGSSGEKIMVEQSVIVPNQPHCHTIVQYEADILALPTSTDTSPAVPLVKEPSAVTLAPSAVELNEPSQMTVISVNDDCGETGVVECCECNVECKSCRSDHTPCCLSEVVSNASNNCDHSEQRSLGRE